MSKKEELEARIKEQRTLEANKKGLVGVSGKIGVVLRTLGDEIIAQSEDTTPGYLMEEEKEDPSNSGELMSYIPIMDIEGNQRPEGPEWGEAGESRFSSTRRIGMYFDGLSRGMHMEIMYDEEKSELSLHHRGYLAYREVMGDLEAYVPNQEWEGWIEALYKKSKEIRRIEKEEEFKRRLAEAEKEKASWWEALKVRWGID